MKETTRKFSWFKKSKKKPGESLESPLQKAIINRVSKLETKDVVDIITPRVDVVSFHIDETLDVVITKIRKAGFSRYPVWENGVDNIIGILYVKDLFYYITNIENPVLNELKIERSLVRKPFFIPESKHLGALLETFQSHKVHIAIILDEYGGFSGIVTLEDIVEVILGDIQDEYDREEDDIFKLSQNVYLVDGRTSLEIVEEKLGIDYSEYKDSIDSIGGLIYSVFDRVPTTGERIEISGITYQVQNISKNKILAVKIWLPIKESNNKDKS
jgi:magnesium and cobalt transporter